jgi:hypothetical protein
MEAKQPGMYVPKLARVPTSAKEGLDKEWHPRSRAEAIEFMRVLRSEKAMMDGTANAALEAAVAPAPTTKTPTVPSPPLSMVKPKKKIGR